MLDIELDDALYTQQRAARAAAKLLAEERKRTAQEAKEARELAQRSYRFFRDAYYASEEWKAIRAVIVRRDDNACTACGGKAETVTHLIPVALGGLPESDNLTSSCFICQKATNGHVFASPDERRSFVQAHTIQDKPKPPKPPISQAWPRGKNARRNQYATRKAPQP